MPVVSATALTVAATLSIAAEHARSSPAAALGALFVHSASQGQSDGGTASTSVRHAITPVNGTTAVAPSPAVGSRVLTSDEEGR
jgi:hypothetical protein